jgi:hypothetical protein
VQQSHQKSEFLALDSGSVAAWHEVGDAPDTLDPPSGAPVVRCASVTLPRDHRVKWLTVGPLAVTEATTRARDNGRSLRGAVACRRAKEKTVNADMWGP